MVLGDVDSGFAQQRTDTANHPGNIVVRENEQRVARLHIDMERADSCQPRRQSWLRRTRNRYLLHPSAQPDFDRIRIILRRGFGRR